MKIKWWHVALIVAIGIGIYYITQHTSLLKSRGKTGKATLPNPISEAQWKDKLKSGDKFGVTLTASWCHHCKVMKPAIAEASTKVKSLYNFDATNAQTPLMEKFGVKGFPSILYFDGGKKTGEYKGNRTASDIISKSNSFLS